MEKLMCYLKENKFLKVYLIFYSLINLLYTYFIISKFQYIQKYSLGGTIEKYQFEFLSNISQITSLLESLILLIYLGYLIKVIMGKDRRSIKHFLIINFALFIIFSSIKYFISIVFSVPFWPLTILLYTPLVITLTYFILVITNILYILNVIY